MSTRALPSFFESSAERTSSGRDADRDLAGRSSWHVIRCTGRLATATPPVLGIDTRQ
jgi:hypothetical protein